MDEPYNDADDTDDPDAEIDALNSPSAPTAFVSEQDAPAEPVKRGRGRPKGLPKTGGRAALPTTPGELRAYITRELGKVDGLLAIARGEQVNLSGSTGKSYRGYPPVADRLKAWELLLRKVMPDLGQIQLTGDGGGPIELEHSNPDTRDLARSILDILGSAAPKPPIDRDADDAEEDADALAFGGPSGGAAGGDDPPVAAGPTIRTSRTIGGDDVATHYPRADEQPKEMSAEDLIAERKRKANGLGSDPWPSTPTDTRPSTALPRGERVPPRFSGSMPTSHFQAGERVLVDGARGWLEFQNANGDGRQRFYVVNSQGIRQCAILGQPEAEAALREFEQTGKIGLGGDNGKTDGPGTPAWDDL